MEYIFWFLFLLVFYVYAVYPLVLRIINFSGKSSKNEEITPSVTLFVPVYNEAGVIKEKILNSLDLNYPKDKLEIIVASDGSTDETVSIARDFFNEEMVIFDDKERKGKNYVINKYIPKCSGKIIVFTDANSFFDRNAIKKLVRDFSDERVGCVVGNLKYVDKKTSVGKGEGLYFRYESMIKMLEGRHGTLVAATGSIYAIRKSLFIPLDSDVANDFAHPIQIAARGYKVVFESEAVAYEKATSSSDEEFKRRARIVTRGITAFLRYRERYRMLRGMWGFCFISHKLLRWLVPFFLIVLFLTNLFLHSTFFKFTLYSQIGFYSAALTGAFFKEKIGRFFSIPFYFCLINSAALIGIIRYLRGSRESVWEIAKTTR
ncbi:MAG: glycosyltransferase family 2 protein [Acetobacterium woodii]|nr:glycosyltransferase family 2 protein [Acetobacterium woodii]